MASTAPRGARHWVVGWGEGGGMGYRAVWRVPVRIGRWFAARDGTIAMPSARSVPYCRHEKARQRAGLSHRMLRRIRL